MSEHTILDIEAVTVPGPASNVLGLTNISLQVAGGDLVLLEPEHHVETVSLYDVASGLIDPVEGAVRFDGVDWRRMGLYRSCAQRVRIGRIFAVEGWVSNLSMYENIALAQRHHTYRRDPDLRRAALALLERIGLHDCLDQRPHMLSRGQRRRAQWVRAFMGTPDLLLLNAPLLDVRPEDHAPLVALMTEARTRGAAVVWKSREAAALLQRPGFEAARYGVLSGGALEIKRANDRSAA